MKFRNIVTSAYNQPTDWKEWGGQIIEARKELAEHGHEMDAYTRNHLDYQIRQMKEAHLPAVLGGMLEEFNGAISEYQAAQNKMMEARQAEARSWDAGKLANELNVANTLVGMVIKSKTNPFRGGPTATQRLEAIWQDALLSQDKTKIRAVAEVLLSIRDTSLDNDIKLAANTIASNAAARLTEIRENTPEIMAAATEIVKARDWLHQVYQAERQGMLDLGEGDPAGLFAGGEMGKAYRRIRAGQNGQITILDESDPEVLGYTIPEPKNSEGSDG